MSLLNDLQEQVKRIRAEEDAQDAQRNAQAEFYQQHLRPVMHRAYEYFAEIVEHLNIVVPDITVRYPLDPHLPKGIAMKQSQYKCRADNREAPRQIDIFCRCTLEKPHEFYLSSPRAIQNHAELLDAYNFAYHRKNKLDSHHQIRGAAFILEGPMLVHIRLAANAANRSVQLGLRNLEQQPVKRYRFSPEAVTDDLFERIGKVLLRQSPLLVDQIVDPGVRHQLQSQIEQARIQQEQDIAQAHADREAELEAEREARLLHRTRRGMQEQARKLLDLVAGKQL